MPRIKCHYLDCAFLDEGICSAGMVELDPDTGCKTYSANAESATEDDWETDEDELEEWEELDDEDDEEVWAEDEPNEGY
jgi:hypothetical protein